MPTSSDDWRQAIPADFYDQLAHSLSLHGMACAELLSRPQDAPLLHLMALTGLNTLRVAELNTIGSHPQLLHELQEQPRALYNLLLLGRLTLETTLALPVMRYVQQQMGIEAQQAQALTTYCLELSGAFLALLEEHLPAEPSLGLHRLRVEEAFTEYIAAHPAPAATIRFTEPQLQMMRLALLLVHSLPEAGDHPFLRAVAALPALQPAALEPLIERLSVLEPTQDFALTMPELVQLYQAMQVCGMVFVSEVLEQVGLGSVFPAVPAAEAAASPAAPPEPSGRQAVGEIVSGFTRWVQYTFPQEPALLQARQQVLALADAL